ncbi:MAG: nicotinate (nicotinamide) nucleotide adenylyltransferase [Pseudomonadota bacterium]|nr:nicotinate (nicotinamide) nucleotide adenylyltransferase [Pseudomonadota bacterium]MDE3038027.1 nicotinate (nicotinamide) nucleotide adenylyltransferase [Pseudomonadota bacterium]
MPSLLARNRAIGLLGGSFNPAHDGHLHITLHALKKLGLDEVWWLVSSQNPLKASSDLAAYEKRLASARALASPHRRIRVLDIEAQENLRYSWQTIAWLKRRYRGAHFVWLMGADNLAQFHRWRRWRQILASIPVIVFDRAPYSHTSLRSKTALYAHGFPSKTIALDSICAAPRLALIHLRRNPVSSTVLRKSLGNDAFLRHNGVVG